MENIEKFIQKFLWKGILVSILFLILGIVLIFNPGLSVVVIAYFVGVILIINGISYMLDMAPKLLIYDPVLIGILSLIFGIIIIINPEIFITLIPIILGIWFIIYGIIKYKFAMILSEVKESGWGISLAGSLLTICSGIILMLCPRVGVISIILVLGILLIIYSISDIVNFFIVKKKIKGIAKFFK